MKFTVRKITTMGMLAAIGIVLVAFIEFPIIPAAGFLKYDPADIPILIGAMIFGPAAGFILTFIVSFSQSFLLHGSGGVIGFIMHLAATGAMVIVMGNVYKRGTQSTARAALSLTLGALAMIIAMIGMNLLLTPIFMGVPVETVIKMLVPAIIPFNVIKAGINSLAAFILYKGCYRIISRTAGLDKDK